MNTNLITTQDGRIFLGAKATQLRGEERVCIPLTPVEVPEEKDCRCECCCDCPRGSIQGQGPETQYQQDTSVVVVANAMPSALTGAQFDIRPMSGQHDPSSSETHTQLDSHIGIFFDGFNMNGRRTSHLALDPITHDVTRRGFATMIYHLFASEYPFDGQIPQVNSRKYYFPSYIWHPEEGSISLMSKLERTLDVVPQTRRNIRDAYERIQEEFCHHVEFWEDRWWQVHAGMCSQLRIDIFGYSWGAVQALELAWQLATVPLRCQARVHGRLYEVQHTPRIRFMGLVSPTDAFINGDVDYRLGMRLGDPDTGEVRRFGSLAAAATSEVSGWRIPQSWTAPDIIDNGFLAYRDPRVPERDWWRAMAFQHEQRVTLSPSTRNESNAQQSVGKPAEREWTYLSNHSDLGGFCREGIRAGRDLWQAWAFSAEESPEAAAYRLWPYEWEIARLANVDPRLLWNWEDVSEAEQRWSALNPTDLQAGLPLIQGAIWPFGNPSRLAPNTVPDTPQARAGLPWGDWKRAAEDWWK